MWESGQLVQIMTNVGVRTGRLAYPAGAGPNRAWYVYTGIGETYVKPERELRSASGDSGR